MTQTMDIRQAARWAERKDALYINGDFNNPMCAVWKSSTHDVVCLGSYEKCRSYITGNSLASSIPVSGIYYATSSRDALRMDSLDDILLGMSESEGEAACIPDACELREWA